MTVTLHPPAGPWTVADLDSIPDVGFRFEIHGGSLVMVSPVRRWHSRVARRLANVLEAAGHQVDTEVGVRRSPRSTRVADVAVFRPDVTELGPAFFDPGQLTMVVEIVSDSSEEDDRTDRPRWYAEVGIPEYWRVEEGDDGEAVIFQHALARTACGESAYVRTGVTTLTALEPAGASGTGPGRGAATPGGS